LKNAHSLSSESSIKLRPLISYALSSHSMAHGNDYFQALLPLFAPIIVAHHGELFEPKLFCKELGKVYGLHINEHVAENFIDPMARAGLLEKTSDTQRHRVYRYSETLSEPLEEKYRNFEKKLASIFDEYHVFVSGMETLIKGVYDQEQLEEGLINWILRNNKKFSLSNEYAEKPKSDLDFIASRFLQHLEKSNTSLFGDLSLIHSGAIVSELVLDYKLPETSKKKVRDLNVVLDAPFVMHLLNLSGKQNYEGTNSIFKQLKRLEVQLHVFKHSCEEIEGNIDAVLSPSNPDRRGPLASALISGDVIEDYVRTVRNSLDDKIKKLGIKIFDPSSYGTQQNREKYFTKEVEDRLYEAIPWPKVPARERDVESVSTIMRWRSGKKERDFLKSKYLFVTNNRSLSSRAKKFCIDEKLIQGNHAPPVISVQTLSGILFLMIGDEGERLSLSRKQLLASCGKVAIATPEIIESLNKKLKELSPDNKDQIEAILSEPRTVQFAMDLTWGNPEVLTRDNVEEVLENLKEDIASEQTEKHKKKFKAVSKECNVMANDNSKLRADQMGTVLAVVSRTVRNINKSIFCIKAIVAAGLFIALFGTSFNLFPDNGGTNVFIFISGLCAFAINIYSFWWSPQWLSKRIESWKKKRTEKNLDKIGLNGKQDEYLIDWKKGTVRERNGDLFPESTES